MPEFLRTLLVLVVLATIVFAFARPLACPSAFDPGDYSRRRNLWFSVTIATFLANNYWLYIVLVGGLLYFAVQKERSRLVLFFALLFAVPPIPNDIGALGIFNFLFTIDYVRLLALMVLLPAYLELRKRSDVDRFGQRLPDKLLAGYLIVQFCLILSVSSFTNAVRVGVFYPFIGVFLPYFVASRATRNLQDFRAALMAFVVAALLLSAIGFVEFARHWLLYDPLEKTLDVSWKLSRYLARDSALRAQASAGQPIPLGYVIAVAIGFSMYLRRSVCGGRRWLLGMGLLTVGLLSTLSRGPWVGALAAVLVFIVSSPHPARSIMRFAVAAALIVPLVMAAPVGEQILGYLPWVGSADTKTVDYRAQLLQQSIVVIMQNPYFGAPDYIYASELQDLATGTGFIDIVNTYVAVAMAQGLISLSLFVGVFVATLIGIVGAMKNITNRESETYFLGQGLLAALIGILVIIGTVSSVSIISVVYWSVAGLGVAYVRMVQAESMRLKRAPLSAT